MNESGKFGVYKKKLQGICDENNLVYKFHTDSYPIMLTVQTTGDIDGQMSMLEQAEEDGYRSPDARLKFAYKDGELVYRISETFTINDALFNKLKNLFKNMHTLWLQFFHREITEKNLLSNHPKIVDDDSDSNQAKFDDEWRSAENNGIDSEFPNDDEVRAADDGSDLTKGKDYNYEPPEK